jgi:hypothetical protein
MNRTRASSLDAFGTRNQRNRILATMSGINSVDGVSGSSLAGTFMRDAIAGSNSVDIITIGDSNAGFSYGGFGGGGGGWTRGLLRALNTAGAQTFASPLMPIMSSTTTITTGVVLEDNGTTTSTIAGYFSNVTGPSGTLLRGSVSGPAGLTNQVVPNTTFLPYGLTQFNYAWVAGSTTNNTFSQLNGTYPGGASPQNTLPSWTTWGTANLKYRVVYSTNTTGGGQLIPTIYKVTFPGSSYVALASTTQTTGTGATLKQVDTTFTMPNDSPGTPANQSALVFGWNYINNASGPVAAIYDCVYKVAKGVAVNNMHYGSGQTTTTIANVITGANGSDRNFLETYFGQIVKRQTDAGGTGRVIIWINGGINGGGDTGTTWQTNMGNMITTLQNAWNNAGYTSDKLAFVCSVSHPLDTDYGGTTEANLAGSRIAADAWASSSPNTTVINLSRIFTAAQMTSLGYYAGAGSSGSNSEAHMSQAGYYAFSQQIVSRLLSSV